MLKCINHRVCIFFKKPHNFLINNAELSLGKLAPNYTPDSSALSNFSCPLTIGI